MGKFYFDYYSHINLGRRVGQPFNGANNGTELLLLQIMKSEYYGRCPIKVVYPKGFEPRDAHEKSFIKAEKFESVYVDKLDNLPFEPGDIIFIPLVCGRELIEADNLKKKFPYLKIYGRVHDKNHNFPYDIKDRLYYSGIRRTGLMLTIDWFGKRILFRIKYGQWISNFDKIFTVSNYSLQRLKHNKVKSINYYYQGVLDYYINKAQSRIPNNGDNKEFLLFISGGRPEKNCLRTILAFERYKAEHPKDKVKLYITSTKKETRKNLLRTLSHYKEFKPEHVKFYDYLSFDELNELYVNCKFLLFTSKGEGFGLPILEAMMGGRPTLASWNTSIPEVAGSSIRYINPFDIDSIKKGIEYYSVPENLEFYEKAVRRRGVIVKEQIKEDADMLFRELFEEL